MDALALYYLWKWLAIPPEERPDVNPFLPKEKDCDKRTESKGLVLKGAVSQLDFSEGREKW